MWVHQPLVVAVQEIKLKIDTNFNTHISNYSYIDQRLETDGNAAGGVGLYIHKDVVYHRIKLNTQFQAIAIHAFLHKRITICNIYINPQQNFTKGDLEQLVAQLPKPYILTGDFNSHNTVWHDHWTQPDDNGRTVENFILDNDLNVLDEDEHTYEQFRPDGTLYRSHIDLTLITPDLQPDLDWTTLDDNGNSDHLPIQITINKSYDFDTFTRWNLKKADWDKYRQLAIFDKPIQDFSTIQELADYIVETINYAGDQAIGKIKIENGKIPKPWWNSACKQATKNKKKAYRKFKRTPNTENHIAYKKANAIAVRTIRQSKRESWETFLASINSYTSAKDLWGKINAMKGKNKNKSVSSIKTTDSKIVDQKGEIATELAKHFQNISNGQNSSEAFKNFRENNQNYLDFNTNTTKVYNLGIKITELKNILKKSKDTSPGMDGIPYIMIRQLPEDSLKYILDFYNRIFLKHEFPEKWKAAVIIPILKPGKDSTKCSSYRPIALISCLSKILEKILNKRLMWYLEKNKLIDKSQCGFRQGRSTTDHTTRLTSDIQEALVNNEYHISIFLDLEKAYDTVWKQVILNQLLKFDIKGHLAFYIKNFLEHRSIKVKVGNYFSENFLLDLGVPQGSSISVTLFLIAVNTILDFIPGNIQKSLFVDDCRISLRAKFLDQKTKDRLQSILNNLEKWASQTGFKFAEGKSELLICTRKIPKTTPNLGLFLDNKKLKIVTEKKFLGVWFDWRMTWKTHINNVRSDCMRALKLLKTIAFSKNKTDTKMLLRIYKTMILPKLEYGCLAYGTASVNNLKILDPIHHQALRICLGAFHTTPIKSLYVETNLHSLSYRRKILGIKYYARTLTIPKQNTICNLYDTRRDELFRDSKRFETVAIKIRLDMKELDIHFPPILEQHLSVIPPWIIPVTKTCFDMEKFPKNEIPSAEIVSEFLKHKHNSDIDIYTDGSKTELGVGSGLAVYRTPNSRPKLACKPQSSKATILSAELKAISYSLDSIYNLRKTNCTIYSDSKGSLQSIQQYDPKNPLVQEIQRKLTLASTHSNKVIFCWIPAHTGIPGNEKADEQAKLASATTPSTLSSVLAKDLYAHIHIQGKKWLQHQWDSEDQNKLHFVDGKIGEKNYHCFLTRREEIKYNRIRLGHTRLTNKHLAAGEGPPICIMCNRPITTRHIFSKCPLYTEARNKFFPGKNFKSILSRKSNENSIQVTNFLKYTKLFNEI